MDRPNSIPRNIGQRTLPMFPRASYMFFYLLFFPWVWGEINRPAFANQSMNNRPFRAHGLYKKEDFDHQKGVIVSRFDRVNQAIRGFFRVSSGLVGLYLTNRYWDLIYTRCIFLVLARVLKTYVYILFLYLLLAWFPFVNWFQFPLNWLKAISHPYLNYFKRFSSSYF